jgi:hypothetical protein
MTVRSSALGAGRALPPESSLVVISAKGTVHYRVIMVLEGVRLLLLIL